MNKIIVRRTPEYDYAVFINTGAVDCYMGYDFLEEAEEGVFELCWLYFGKNPFVLTFDEFYPDWVMEKIKDNMIGLDYRIETFTKEEK
jgi:ATP phosphoribosyltransferase